MEKLIKKHNDNKIRQSEIRNDYKQ